MKSLMNIHAGVFTNRRSTCSTCSTSSTNQQLLQYHQKNDSIVLVRKIRRLQKCPEEVSSDETSPDKQVFIPILSAALCILIQQYPRGPLAVANNMIKVPHSNYTELPSRSRPCEHTDLGSLLASAGRTFPHPPCLMLMSQTQPLI